MSVIGPRPLLVEYLPYYTRSNYEKLQIYRIMFNDNSSNNVIRKFVNETFHIENDYLFQLNPCEFDTVPQYIIDECDKEVCSTEHGSPFGAYMYQRFFPK